jgi:D-hydroxyproline dehydrogenase subunit gamma
MSESVTIVINGRPQHVAAGTTAAAAVLIAGLPSRRSVSGEARAPVCGMGVCMECRLTIDGQPHVRSCQVACRDGMEIATDA